MSLTAEERERGWVEHHCDEHGFLVATTPRAIVNCHCGKVARILRSGRIVSEATLKPTDAKARSQNAAGQPNLYACGDCGQDFGSETLLRRHRVGRGRSKRCSVPAEMVGRNWFVDERGRWRKPGPKSPTRQAGCTVTEAVTALLSPVQPEDDATPVPEYQTPEIGQVHTYEPEPFSNPTRAWKRGAPGSRNGEARRRSGGSTREGFVYFFQGDTTRRIKIGFSEDPERRLTEIRSGASERMRLLGSIAGTTTDEAAQHRANASAHVLNEWFAEDVLPDVAQVLGVAIKELEEIPFL